MKQSARLIDPPATKMSPIPDAIRFFGETHDPAALDAWLEVMTATGTHKEREARFVRMAERILEDPQQALEEMRDCLPEAETRDEPYMGHDGSPPQPETWARARARELGFA